MSQKEVFDNLLYFVLYLLTKNYSFMKITQFLLFMAGCFLFTSEALAQTATIDSDFQITVSEASANSVYTIDISTANFASEQEARQVFTYYQRHPALNFNLKYSNSQVLMKVKNLQLSQGTADLNYQISNIFPIRAFVCARLLFLTNKLSRHYFI